MIFKHFLNDSIEEDLVRAKKVCDQIHEEFENSINPDSCVYIVDPYLDPVRDIYYPFSKNETDDNIWSYFLSYLIEDLKNGKIMILTSFDLTQLGKLIPGKLSYPFDIKHSLGSCQVLISKILKGRGVKSPDELHDRLILLEGTKQLGFHIGPSLTNLERKDCTITKFESKKIKDSINRIKDIWEMSLKIRV